MKLVHLQRFVAIVDADLHVPRAADATGIPLASLYSAIDTLEEETGQPLFTRAKSGWGLTEAGALLLDEAHRRIAEAPTPTTTPAVAAGGKAKASKGKGRAPIVKGQPKPYKKRQGR
ncbi:regulatory helix-turn-helix protein, lysR family [Agromyces sp. CF514]|uniref:LysR family transcriptional regulator n=1 Tax=Agromyces sp. CF514 TaxID=1881031 RepID=UPI0008F296A6|nr:LysR family transcriptional regulator [Agromyces sp. CF514]SFR74095.1 regulatory helix-turn-helix protein, lysR family [Agromyces sp. CF514]